MIVWCVEELIVHDAWVSKAFEHVRFFLEHGLQYFCDIASPSQVICLKALQGV
jgi:hypothetical protein